MTKDPDTILVGTYYKQFNYNCVYAWKRGEEWLYVGTSAHGLNRVFDHNVIDKVEDVQPTDAILVWTFEDTFTARLEELTLILEHSPKYNKVKDARQLFGGLLAKKRFDHKRYE